MRKGKDPDPGGPKHADPADPDPDPQHLFTNSPKTLHISRYKPFNLKRQVNTVVGVVRQSIVLRHSFAAALNPSLYVSQPNWLQSPERQAGPTKHALPHSLNYIYVSR